MNIDEMKDRIARAEEIQRYTENRCEALEKENAELKKLKRECETSLCRAEYQYNYEQLTKAKELLERLLITSCNSDVLNLLPNCSEVLRVRVEAEQFLKDETEQEEPYYVIMNMNCQYEICRKCPKSGLFKGTQEECEKWIEQKEKEEND